MVCMWVSYYPLCMHAYLALARVLTDAHRVLSTHQCGLCVLRAEVMGQPFALAQNAVETPAWPPRVC